MKKWIVVRGLLMGALTLTLKYLFDGQLNLLDILAPIILLLAVWNELRLRKMRQ